jgi:hypothetical protein
MGAARTQGVELVVDIDQEHLCAVNTLNLELLLLAGLELQGCKALELEFPGHG